MPSRWLPGNVVQMPGLLDQSAAVASPWREREADHQGSRPAHETQPRLDEELFGVTRSTVLSGPCPVDGATSPRPPRGDRARQLKGWKAAAGITGLNYCRLATLP